jgi:hypothetical protein
LIDALYQYTKTCVLGEKLKMKKQKMAIMIILSSLLTLAIPLVSAAPSDKAKGKPGHLNDGTYVYVISQEKYYRTIVPISPDKGLPPNGPFQQLFGAPGPLSTMYGPGDQGYVGGRWWIDVTGDGHSADDIYFLCPLLGPALDSIPE